jgi:hypothetical protein
MTTNRKKNECKCALSFFPPTSCARSAIFFTRLAFLLTICHWVYQSRVLHSVYTTIFDSLPFTAFLYTRAGNYCAPRGAGLFHSGTKNALFLSSVSFLSFFLSRNPIPSCIKLHFLILAHLREGIVSSYPLLCRMYKLFTVKFRTYP